MRALPLLLALLVAAGPSLPAAAQVVNSAVPGSGGVSAAVPALEFGLSREQLRTEYRTAAANLDGALKGIAATPLSAATFENTVLAQEKAVGDFVNAVVPLTFQMHVSPDEGVRKTALAIEKVMNRRFVELGQRRDLYELAKAAAAKGQALSKPDARLLDKTLRDYRDNGLELTPEKRERLKAIQKKLADLSTQFELNINEHKDWLEVDEAGLAGTPADFKEGLEKTADGKYKVGLDYPTYVPFMRYAKDGELRRELYKKFENRAMPVNMPLLKEGLELRREQARLLGYADYPTLALRDRMARTPKRVMEFLDRLGEKLGARAAKEDQALFELKRRERPDAVVLEDHERAYYGRLLREEKYAFDSEEVKQYFPVDTVVEGVLSVYQRILGVRFRELKDAKVWHPDVRAFEISDAKTGAFIGHFYLDLYPREGKYTHAAAFPLRMGRAVPGGYEATAAAMVANFPKAVGGKPALLPHAEVETFFHEFGHLMHQTLTKARHMSFSGSSVALDFVEAPSQMLENFAWEREVLDEVSGHWKTGEKLPDGLFEKMTAARRFNEASGTLGQIAYATADMALHTLVPADPSKVFNDVLGEITGHPVPAGMNMVASFGHLMGGYGAGYYAYLWSLVFAEDIYSVFRDGGPLNPEVGLRYRKEILETGSERPEEESLAAFLGRAPSDKAFMESLEEKAPEPSALVAARRRVGRLPPGVKVSFLEHFSPTNPQVLIEVDGVKVYWEYLYHAEKDLARLNFRWYKPWTWFAGFGKPTDDLSARYEAALRIGFVARERADARAAEK